MIIKELYIKKFGKLENKKILLKDGFNIVYGENESGKSTIQGFIKSMLYGLALKRGKDIKNNERVRFMPLSGEKAYGEILISYDDKDIIIERSFGATKKDDESKVIDNLTGETLTNYSKDEPGRDILGINGEGFNNTLFIKQLGSGVNASKNDELLNKISNTLQSGEEKVSYQKVKFNLEELRKSLVTTRKSGRLDLLKVKYHNLLEELYEKRELNNENIENELKLIDLKKHRKFLNNEIEKLEIAKKYLKKIKLESEYKEITNYLRKGNSLKKQKAALEDELKNIGEQVSEEFLLSIKEEAKVYFNILDLLKERQSEIENLSQDIERKKHELLKYDKINDLPDNSHEKILKLILEEETLRDNYAILNIIKDELRILKHRQLNLEMKLKEYKISSDIKEDIKINLKNYEEKLRDIKLLVGERNLDFQAKLKLNQIKNKINLINVAGGIFLAVGTFSAYKIIGEKSLLFTISAFVSLATMLSISLIRKNISKKVDDLKEQSNLIDKVSKLKEDIFSIEKNLDIYSEKIGTKGYEDFILLIKEYDLLESQFNENKLKIIEKENSFTQLKGNEVLEKVNKNNEIKEKLLRVTKCVSLNQLLDIIKEYNIDKNNLEKVEIEFNEKEKGIVHLREDLDIKETLIRKKLNEINLEYIHINDIFNELDKIIEKIQIKNQLQQSLKFTEDSYNLLLKNRAVEDLEEELKNFIVNTESFSYENEEEIENEIREKNNDLLNTEKKIKDVEHSIKASMLTTRKLAVIEEDINCTKDSIEKYEKTLKGIDIAIKLLDESFKDIQKNFGPILNTKVSNIFNKLTNGEYNEVKVSENYELLVRNNITNSLVNINFLSNGTWDQVYLSLRLAMIDMIFYKNIVPIILDESFSQYDDKRLKIILKFLNEISQHKQIILFTSQKRELDIMKDINNINIINL